MSTILFCIAIVIVAWLGLRHLITIVIGLSQDGPLKRGQRLCHATALFLYWGACVFAILYHHWWPLLIGTAVASLFRKIVIQSGKQA